VNAQTPSIGTKFPIVNGLAIVLPKPDYPQEAKDFCAAGVVSIKVEIDEKGDVISTEAIAGDELLHETSIKAVKKAKFKVTGYGGLPIKVRGIVVYNFPPVKNCIIAEVINKKAKSIPKPDFPKSCRCAGIVKVEVIIDVFSGKVINARTLSGNPLLRISALNSAKKALFSPSMINDVPIFIKGLLIYNFSSSGEVQF
jgi:outer membrane biosynthesis protein TonB